jgi:hypothetical protein
MKPVHVLERAVYRMGRRVKKRLKPRIVPEGN